MRSGTRKSWPVRTTHSGLLAALLFAMTSGSAGASGPASLYWVDLEAAVQRLEDGAEARRTLATKRKALQRAIDRREAKLTERRADLSAAKYASELEAHHARVKREQDDLRAMQDELLQPVLSKLRARIERLNRQKRTLRVVTVQDGLLIGPPPACDRTAWLVRAYAEPTRPFSQNRARCTVRRVMTVDVDRVMASLPEAAGITARLQAFMDARQVDLDRRRRQQREIAEKVRLTGDRRWKEELAIFSADLDRRYATYHAELRSRELTEEDALYGKVADGLAVAGAKASGIWFAESNVTDAVPHCDATEWAIHAMTDKRPARSPACGAVQVVGRQP